MERSTRRWAVLSAASLLLPVTAVLLTSGPAHAAGPTATFTKTQDWGTGYTGQFTIENGGTSAITSWTIEFDLPAGTSVGTYWDAVQVSNQNGHYVFGNREYNGTVQPGGTTGFGFVASGGGSPTGCTLNGAACDGGGGDPGDTEPPTVPGNLRVTEITPTSVSLAWGAASDDSGVAGYEVTVDGTSALVVQGTSATVTGLTPETTYRFRVRALDEAGNRSGFSNEVTATTPAGDDPPDPPGEIRVAPYIDITMSQPTLPEVARATGHRHFTLAFVLGSSAGCDPRWGGTIDLNEPRIVGQVEELQEMGGDVIVASGGALGPYLENVCGSTSALVAAYKRALDAVGSNHLDVDVEASIPVDMVNQALLQLQRERGTEISYTLRVQGDDYGLDPFSVSILRDAASKGLDVLVNPMTMEFGSSREWGDAVIAAAESTLGQMREVWPNRGDAELKRRLGVTPMIGRNFNGRIFNQSHARQLVSWASANDVGLLAFWSVGRDNGTCPGGGVSPTCSSISQSLYEFTNIFKGFRG